MKRTGNIAAAVVALSLVAGVALATTAENDSQLVPGGGPCYGMMNGQGFHHGFGGPGMYGKAKRGGNQGCWKGNDGSQMGPKGMMGKGYGRRGMMMNPEMREKRDAFLDATKELRKEMMERRFAYREAQRNSDITIGELQKQEKEIYALREQIQSKRAEFFKIEKAE